MNELGFKTRDFLAFEELKLVDRGASFTEQTQKELDPLKQYNAGLKLLIQGKKTALVPTQTGTGKSAKIHINLRQTECLGNFGLTQKTCTAKIGSIQR